MTDILTAKSLTRNYFHSIHPRRRAAKLWDIHIGKVFDQAAKLPFSKSILQRVYPFLFPQLFYFQWLFLFIAKFICKICYQQKCFPFFFFLIFNVHHLQELSCLCVRAYILILSSFPEELWRLFQCKEIGWLKGKKNRLNSEALITTKHCHSLLTGHKVLVADGF